MGNESPKSLLSVQRSRVKSPGQKEISSPASGGGIWPWRGPGVMGPVAAGEPAGHAASPNSTSRTRTCAKYSPAVPRADERECRCRARGVVPSRAARCTSGDLSSVMWCRDGQRLDRRRRHGGVGGPGDKAGAPQARGDERVAGRHRAGRRRRQQHEQGGERGSSPTYRRIGVPPPASPPVPSIAGPAAAECTATFGEARAPRMAVRRAGLYLASGTTKAGRRERPAFGIVYGWRDRAAVIGLSRSGCPMAPRSRRRTRRGSSRKLEKVPAGCSPSSRTPGHSPVLVFEEALVEHLEGVPARLTDQIVGSNVPQRRSVFNTLGGIIPGTGGRVNTASVVRCGTCDGGGGRDRRAAVRERGDDAQPPVPRSSDRHHPRRVRRRAHSGRLR